MTNQERKDWGYANLERDTLDPAAAQRNVIKHGAHNIRDILGPSCWPETYGQTPWDNTMDLAYRLTRNH